MIVLTIIGAVLLLFLILLLCPVTVEVFAGEGETWVKARYLFLYYMIFPRPAPTPGEEEKKKRKEEKKAAKKQRKKEKQPEEEEKKKKSKLAFRDILDLVKSSKKALGILRRHLIFSKTTIYLSVGAEDAHQTALRYGQISIAVPLFLDIIGSLFVLRKNSKVVVLPDFTRETIAYEVYTLVSIRPLFALAAGCSVLWQFLRITLLAPRTKKNPSAPKSKTAV